MYYQTQFVELKNLPPADCFLSAAESEYLLTLKAAKRKTDWLGGRFALKVLLARIHGLVLCELPLAAQTDFLDISLLTGRSFDILQQIETLKLPSGAPQAFVNGVLEARHISITHSNGVAVAACAAEGFFLGIDLEKIEPRSAAWADTFFTDAERLDSSDSQLTRVWTQKEAVVKLLGTGLSLSTQEIELGGGKVVLLGRAEQVWKELNCPEIKLDSRLVLDGFMFTVAYTQCEKSN